MEKVVVDLFIVPEEAREEFLEATRKVQSFLKTLPGYVEGFVYEKEAGPSSYNVITTAVWKDQEAVEQTKDAIRAEFQRQGFNPQEMMQRLRVEALRSFYDRQPY